MSRYRQRQVKELVKFVSKSDADFVLLGGDFNVDPKASIFIIQNHSESLTHWRDMEGRDSLFIRSTVTPVISNTLETRKIVLSTKFHTSIMPILHFDLNFCGI